MLHSFYIRLYGTPQLPFVDNDTSPLHDGTSTLRNGTLTLTRFDKNPHDYYALMWNLIGHSLKFKMALLKVKGNT